MDPGSPKAPPTKPPRKKQVEKQQEILGFWCFLGLVWGCFFMFFGFCVSLGIFLVGLVWCVF